MKATRFDLEQQILNCWNVTDDLDVIVEAVLEQDLSKDEITNLLMGLKSLYHLKFEKCFETFEQLVSARQLEAKPAWPFEGEGVNESF